jgi:hypothetical protein
VRTPNAFDLRWCLIAGLAVLAITFAMLPWSPASGCGPPSAVPPIIAFELATDAADLAALFGPPGPCRAALIADLHIINLIDYLFMIAYGVMLIAALDALGARRGLLIVAAIAPLADAIENLALLQLDLGAPGGWLIVTIVAVRAKFVVLGIVSGALVLAMWHREPGRLRWLALAHVPAAPAAIAGAFVPALAPLITPTLALSWLAVVVWAILRSVRRR